MSRPGCKRVGSFFLLRVYWGSGWMINEKTISLHENSNIANDESYTDFETSFYLAFPHSPSLRIRSTFPLCF